MNDRARAISLLKKARDLLAERLTERVLESDQEILEDAEGLSYTSEIEAIYEQLGSRLMQVGQIISSLPPILETTPEESPGTEAIVSDADIAGLPENQLPAVASQYVDASGSPLVGPMRDKASVEAPSAASFQSFAMQILAGDLDTAGRSLAELFGIDEHRAAECAKVFAQHLKEDPAFLAKAQGLRHELHSDRSNGVIMLLYECFGLSGMESIHVLQALKVQVSRGF